MDSAPEGVPEGARPGCGAGPVAQGVGGQAARERPPGAETGPAGDGGPPTGRREGGRARQRRQRQAAEQGSPLYRLKVEGAQALGLWEKVQAVGWGGLSAAESGRVGGYITRMLRMGGEAPAPPAGP